MLQEHLIIYRFSFCWCLKRWHNEYSNPQVCTSMEDGKWDGIFVVVKKVISKIIFPWIAFELDKNFQPHDVLFSSCQNQSNKRIQICKEALSSVFRDFYRCLLDGENRVQMGCTSRYKSFREQGPGIWIKFLTPTTKLFKVEWIMLYFTKVHSTPM